jgi:hypothetical protein
MISLNRGEAMGTNTRLERLETTLDSDTLTRHYTRGMRRDQYPRVHEAISQPVRRRRCARALAIEQGFGLTKSTDAGRNCSEVTAHVACRLAESLTNGRDERVRVREREKKWELWVARLVLSYLQHYVFYTSLAGLCDSDTKSSLCAACALRSADPTRAARFGHGLLLGVLT